MGKNIWIPVTIILVALMSFIGLNLWLELSKPPIETTMYSGRGDTIYQEKLFNDYICKDCISVEVNGYYEFVFPNWKYNGSKLYVNISNVKCR